MGWMCMSRCPVQKWSNKEVYSVESTGSSQRGATVLRPHKLGCCRWGANMRCQTTYTGTTSSPVACTTDKQQWIKHEQCGSGGDAEVDSSGDVSTWNCIESWYVLIKNVMRFFVFTHCVLWMFCDRRSPCCARRWDTAAAGPRWWSRGWSCGRMNRNSNTFRRLVLN